MTVARYELYCDGEEVELMPQFMPQLLPDILHPFMQLKCKVDHTQNVQNFVASRTKRCPEPQAQIAELTRFLTTTVFQWAQARLLDSNQIKLITITRAAYVK
jgi:hypothetical protein